jgi:predicted glycosyltransferase
VDRSAPHVERLRDCYDAIWIYADPAVYDVVRECGVFDAVADRIHFTGYLDQRPRLELARSRTESLLSKLPAAGWHSVWSGAATTATSSQRRSSMPTCRTT